MAIIGTDFHGNKAKVDAFLQYKPEEQHISAGDIVDSWKETPESQLYCLTTLIESDCVLLYGNHEMSYHPDVSKRMRCSGRHEFGASVFPHLIKEDRWVYAYAVDDFLVTHAGLCACYKVPKKLNTVVNHINNEKIDGINTDIGRSRGGWKPSGGILWYDHLRDWQALNQDFNQIFGHTQSEVPWQIESKKGKKHICLNTRDTEPDFYVYDTKEQSIVKLI